jgi:hypothetical protein
LFDDLLSILLGELLVLTVTIDGVLDFLDFVLGQVAATVFAILPGVEIVIGAVGTLADNRERAVLHALDLEDLIEEGLGGERRIHGRSIDAALYAATKKQRKEGT